MTHHKWFLWWRIWVRCHIFSLNKPFAKVIKETKSPTIGVKLWNASMTTFIAMCSWVSKRYAIFYRMHAGMGYQKGILRTVWAFAGADKKQGRKTLLQHWQIWVEAINKSIKNVLFDKDKNTRNKAWQTLEKRIDNLISTSYGPQFCITHKNASAKMIKKYQKLIILKIYSKRKIMSVFEKLDTKNYTTASEGR